MTMEHANPEDLDLYALGALDGEDKQALEAHMASCAACRRQLATARQRTALIGLSAPPLAPPPGLKNALLQQARAARPAGASRPALKPAGKIRWGLRFSLGFALASALLAFAAFEFARQDLERGRRIEQLQAQVDSDAAALQAMGQITGAPDSAEIALLEQPGGPPGQARVVYNARMGMGIYSGQIAPAPAGKTYQLWLVPASGAPVSAGLVDANQQNGAVVMRLAPGVAAKAFAVTLEPLGGMPQPTGPKVLVGLVNAG